MQKPWHIKSAAWRCRLTLLFFVFPATLFQEPFIFYEELWAIPWCWWHHHTTVLMAPVIGRIICWPAVFLCSGLRQVADHLLGSRPWSCPYVQRTDHAQRRPHTLCCTNPGKRTHKLQFHNDVVSERCFLASLLVINFWTLHHLILCISTLHVFSVITYLVLTVWMYKLHCTVCLCV